MRTKQLKKKTHAASAGHAALAGAEASLANPFGCFSIEDMGTVFETPAAIALHLAARDKDRRLLHIQHAIRRSETRQLLTLFLSASSRGPQQESTLTRLALAGIFGLP